MNARNAASSSGKDMTYGDLESLLRDGSYERLVRDVAERSARQAAELLHGSRSASLTLVGDQSPAAALHRVGESDEVSAIVVGSSHRGTIGRVVPGGVAQRLLCGAPCPVAVAPAGYAARPSSAVGSIGCGFDASEQSWWALRAAAELARHDASPLRVIAVHSPPALDRVPLAPHAAVRTLDERRAADLAGDLQRAVEASRLGDDVVGVLREGDPAKVLAGESDELGLLVVGSRGYGPIGSALLGSVATRLLHTAACPVIVIPRGAADKRPLRRSRRLRVAAGRVRRHA